MRFKKAFAALLVVTLGVVLGFTLPVPTFGQNTTTTPNTTPYPAISRIGNSFYATGYNYAPIKLSGGNTATGAGALTLQQGFSTTRDNRIISPLNINAPVFIDTGSSNQETVTLTAAACGQSVGAQGVPSACIITGTFNNLHGSGALVSSSTYGFDEAVNDAAQNGGGQVVIDNAWVLLGGTNAMITAAQVFPGVTIRDERTGVTRFWNPTPTGAAIAAPTVLSSQAACDATHTFCSDANVAGSANWATAVYGCITYVDIEGNESACSTTANFVPVASKAIDIGLPAASTGAVGWVPYLSLANGTYAQAYQITPTATVCTLTVLETVTPACALTNTTYGQVGSLFGANTPFTGGAQITGYPLNTSQHFPTLGSTAMTATSLTPITNSSSTYTYAPGSRVGVCPGMSSANSINYAASGSSATTIPNAIATWTVPANCFNFIGAEFRVSGKFTFTDGGDATTKVLVAWDAPLSDATTVPTTLCSMLDTATGTGAAYNGTWTCTIKVATVGATGTALVNGYANIKLAAGASTLVRDTTDVAVAQSAATVNLTAPARLVVYFIATGATNNPGAQGLEATLEAVN